MQDSAVTGKRKILRLIQSLINYVITTGGVTSRGVHLRAAKTLLNVAANTKVTK
jgi:hypothetical protein